MVVALDPDIEKRLEARAASRGISALEYVQEVLTKDLTLPETACAPVEGRFRNLSELLLNSPFAGSELDLERSRELPGAIHFG